MECTLGTEEIISLASCFHVLDVANGANDGISLKESTGDMPGLIDGITQKYTLGIALGAYDTLGPHIVDETDDGILLKQCASGIYLAL